LEVNQLIKIYATHPGISRLATLLKAKDPGQFVVEGLSGSAVALAAAALFSRQHGMQVFVVPDKEQAAYLYNDFQCLFQEKDAPVDTKKVLFFPVSQKEPYEPERLDKINVLFRAEVLKRLNSQARKLIVVTYPEALAEKVVNRGYLKKNTLHIEKGDDLSVDFVVDILLEYNFERVSFVVEPGQFSLRGGIVDVFSFGNDYPYRIEFFGDEIESIRSFNPEDQLSVKNLTKLTIIPNVQDQTIRETRAPIVSYLPSSTSIWFDDFAFSMDLAANLYHKAVSNYDNHSDKKNVSDPDSLFSAPDEILKAIQKYHLLEYRRNNFSSVTDTLHFLTKPQPPFNKNFELLIENLRQNHKDGLTNYIFAENADQLKRLRMIFDDLQESMALAEPIRFEPVNIPVHEGFLDLELKMACYTDHQIFDRYQRFYLKDKYRGKEKLTLKELYNLKPGDFVTHIDHGIGKFDGLEKIDNNGKKQEAIRLVYANHDLLYVSIHSLHRIARYTGKDGTPPNLHRLGGVAWANTKNKTKKKVKDIAKDLIALYARRKSVNGIQYGPDTYLQHELEASFIYEDTPDQMKATQDVKSDMEKSYPMDRLVCGDVGFGKTEVAIRAAFKAVVESKQVAVLVPTTILALQHYKTFSDRLKEMPCTIDYISRFKSPAQIKQTLSKLETGEIDIIVGTHRLVSKDVKFKDLGLLVIDEEQKFGVSTKEKLRQLRVNVDTLTLTATPIPRTLQFSMMGARDLSIINTPPPNRYPIHTEIKSFGEKTIREAISYEVSRGGQVFFVHNRVQNIMEVAAMIKKFVPDVKIAVGHGQMDGKKLEKVMYDFIEGHYDVLVATTIIESGLDISNANTMIINDAQNYGLSDLHQLRGRVGRSNKKAFCYLLSPPMASLTDSARKRLKALEMFSDLGSGFNLSMSDLDIRGAGNILGAEQSGFITDIGYEMYQKILNEAMHELKSNEFKDLYEEENAALPAADCQIETDLEIMIPDEYVTDITERLVLYKELDNLETEEQLKTFTEKITDRFGPLPDATRDLMDVIRIRWLAKALGFEKLVIKSGKMVGYFAAQPDSAYFQSDVFGQILEYVKVFPDSCRMKQRKDKLTMVFEGIDSTAKARNTLQLIKKEKVSA
jgi:transcription-repair coupling factor (superfamily II helicase)